MVKKATKSDKATSMKCERNGSLTLRNNIFIN